MSESEDDPDRDADSTDAPLDSDGDPAVGPEAADRTRSQPRADAITQEELDRLRREIDALETDLEERTLHRDEVESDLQKYVRSRVRRGHARGWGPYLVLGYGTAMTLGAFYFLGGGWAILAMLVVWLSTLGLYALMLAVGITVSVAGAPGRLLDRFR